MNVEPGHSIPAIVDISSWFKALSRPVRVALLTDPETPLRGDVAAEVIRSGMLVAGAWFTSVQDGPGEFSLPSDVVDYIEAERATLNDWWSALSDADKDAWRELGDGPLPAELRASYASTFLLPVRDGEAQHVDPVVVDYVQAQTRPESDRSA